MSNTNLTKKPGVDTFQAMSIYLPYIFDRSWNQMKDKYINQSDNSSCHVLGFDISRLSSFGSLLVRVVYKGRWLTQAGYWFILRFCEHFTCLSSKIQNAIKLENISNLITSPLTSLCQSASLVNNVTGWRYITKVKVDRRLSLVFIPDFFLCQQYIYDHPMFLINYFCLDCYYQYLWNFLTNAHLVRDNDGYYNMLICII
jgi:hypothetical protein